MLRQEELIRQVVELLECQGIVYMLVGSLASSSYGEPRFTHDIDIVIDPSEEELYALCDSFAPSDYYVSKSAAAEAMRLRRMFNVIHTASGNKIDFIIARIDEWGREQLDRRKRKELLPGLNSVTAAPEDVILGKLIYFTEGGGDKHLRDIAGMIHVLGNQIDRAYIDRWAVKLEVEDAWRHVLEQVENS